MARVSVPLAIIRTLSGTAARPLCDSIGAAQCSVRSRRRRGDACACARTPTRIEPQRSFKMAAPEVAQWSDYRRVRRYWDVPRHLSQGPRALNRAASSAEHAQRLPQTHHTVRIELGICALSEADQRCAAVPLTSLQQARWALSAQCATVRRSRPPAWAWRPGRGSRCSQIQPRRRTIGPSKLPAVARN